MTTTNRTPTVVALSPSEWARIWGYPEDVALELLQSMRPGIVSEDESGRWHPTTWFVRKFGRAFRELDLEQDSDRDDDEPDPGARVGIENRKDALLRDRN